MDSVIRHGGVQKVHCPNPSLGTQDNDIHISTVFFVGFLLENQIYWLPSLLFPLGHFKAFGILFGDFISMLLLNLVQL